jgi:hypothetical protein
MEGDEPVANLNEQMTPEVDTIPWRCRPSASFEATSYLHEQAF